MLTNVDDQQQQPGQLLGQVPSNAEPGDDSGYQDYFGFSEELRYVLPDGLQWISFARMNEGQRAKYEARTSRDIKFNRRTDDAAIRINASEDRHAVIRESVTGWHMMRRNRSNQRLEPVAFDSNGNITEGGPFMQWLRQADPVIVNDLYLAIQRANPWMNSEMTVEMIDEEIARLEKVRKDTAEREAAQKNS